MISRLLLLVISFTKKEALKNNGIFVQYTTKYSMLLVLCDYVLYSQISTRTRARAHTHTYMRAYVCVCACVCVENCMECKTRESDYIVQSPSVLITWHPTYVNHKNQPIDQSIQQRANVWKISAITFV